MIKRLIFSAITAVVMLLLSSCPSPGGRSRDIVEITDMTTHYRVVIDALGRGHYQIGQDYARKTLQMLPNWEELADSYLVDCIDQSGVQPATIYPILINRTQDIRNQIPADYVNEIEGFYSMLSGAPSNILGDDKISKSELYILNLLPDVGRITQCSAVSVFGDFSATDSTVTGRNLDWYSGESNQFPQMQAVIIFQNGSESVCLIGCLGFMGAISACNDNGIFAAILDSPTGGAYSSLGKRSYPFDIRYALENYSTLDQVAGYLTAATRQYTYGHLIFLSDATESKVVENDVSDNSNRKVRTYTSNLNAGVAAWPSPALDYSIGAVNSFVLNGNTDNHTGVAVNENRWSSLITQLTNYAAAGITVDELKNIISFDNGNGPGFQSTGDLYNEYTQQCIIFQPQTNTLEIYFRARDGSLEDDPVFETIALSF
ncbi:MAG: hypothetical protein JW822_02990 [Spirochaetales bacterium]|nr:hypothetical protein [Spirochaetales bacterium]